MSIKINNLQTFLANDDQENDVQILTFEPSSGIECEECGVLHTDEDLKESVVCVNCGHTFDI